MNNLYLYDSELRKQYPILRGADEAGRVRCVGRYVAPQWF